MAYITGSVTDANPGPALHALMEPALTTAGFTLVDTVVISTRTHKVWKSAAANNTQGLDWYLDIAYTTTGAGNLWIIPFEYYDPATDLGYRGAYGHNALTTLETTYYTRFGATGSALETNWTGPGSTNSLSLTLPASAFGYWISVTGNRVIATTTSGPTSLLYSGMYSPDPLYSVAAGAALYPLVVAKCTAGTTPLAQSSSSPTAALCRVAPWPSLTGSGWQATVRLLPTMPDLTSSPIIPTGSAGYPLAVWPVGVYSFASQSANATVFGSLYDVAACSAAATVARGDTVTISGTTWTLTTYASGSALLFKQA